MGRGGNVNRSEEDEESAKNTCDEPIAPRTVRHVYGTLRVMLLQEDAHSLPREPRGGRMMLHG
jgi:hypothetical protein